MNKLLLITLALISILSISCEDQVSDSGDKDKEGTVINPVGDDKCDSKEKFKGISSVTNITDISADINWVNSTSSAGYTLFSVTKTGFEIIDNFSAATSSATLTKLTADSDYKLIIRSISKAGHYDCNKESKEIRTLERQSFASCLDIKNYYTSSLQTGLHEWG